MLQSTANGNIYDALSSYQRGGGSGAQLRHISSASAFPTHNWKEQSNEVNNTVANRSSFYNSNDGVTFKTAKEEASASLVKGQSRNPEETIKTGGRQEAPKNSSNNSASTRSTVAPSINFGNFQRPPNYFGQSLPYNQINYWNNNTSNSVFFPPITPTPVPTTISTKTTLPHLVTCNNYYSTPMAVGCMIPQNVRPPSNAASAGLGAGYIPRVLTGSPFFHPPPNPVLLSPSNPVMAHFGSGGATNVVGLPSYLIPSENVATVKLQTTVVENKRRDELNAIASQLADKIATVEKSNPNFIPNLCSIQTYATNEKASDAGSSLNKRQQSIPDDASAYKGSSTTISEYSYRNEPLNMAESAFACSSRSSRRSSLGASSASEMAQWQPPNFAVPSMDTSAASLPSAPPNHYDSIASQLVIPHRGSAANSMQLISQTNEVESAPTPAKIRPNPGAMSHGRTRKEVPINEPSTSLKSNGSHANDKSDLSSIVSAKNKSAGGLPPRYQPLKTNSNLSAAAKNLIAQKAQARRSASIRSTSRQVSMQSTKERNANSSSVGNQSVDARKAKKPEHTTTSSTDLRYASRRSSVGSDRRADTPKKIAGNQRRGSLSVRGSLVQTGKPLCVYIGQRSDEGDMKLQEWHNSHNSRVSWRKINKGLYYFGETEVRLDIINGKLMCCVEDGSWNRGKMSSIEKFVAHFEPIERKKIEAYNRA